MKYENYENKPKKALKERLFSIFENFKSPLFGILNEKDKKYFVKEKKSDEM